MESRQKELQEKLNELKQYEEEQKNLMIVSKIKFSRLFILLLRKQLCNFHVLDDTEEPFNKGTTSNV
jgi:hypothetical protein